MTAASVRIAAVLERLDLGERSREELAGSLVLETTSCSELEAPALQMDSRGFWLLGQPRRHERRQQACGQEQRCAETEELVRDLGPAWLAAEA
jgi:hypothetical protein